jgi:hypothetical protein
LHAACSGTSPFHADSPWLTLERVRTGDTVPLDQLNSSIPAWFSQLVQQLLAKAPADRPGSAIELVEALERGERTSTDWPAAPAAAVPRSPKRHQWWRAAALVVLAACVLGGLGGLGTLAAFLLSRNGKPETIQAAVTPPEKPLPLPDSGFLIVDRKLVLGQLSEALAAAQDGDVIEVLGNGPYATPPLRTTGKRLTIRAAKGGRPVLLPEVEGRLQNQPLLTTDSDLHLEGLEIRWTIQLRPGPFDADLLAHCVILSTQDKLSLTHCRIVTGRVNAAVGTTGRELVLKNCHLVASQGACTLFRPAPGGRVHVEGCLFQGGFAFTVVTAAEIANTDGVPVSLTENTFATEKTFQFLLDPRPRQPLNVDARHNLFGSSQLIMLYLVRHPRRIDTPPPEALFGMLREFVHWTEEANVHGRGNRFLAYNSAQRPGIVQASGLDGAGDWLKRWNLPATHSVEGTLRFQEREGAEPATPVRVDKIDDRSGPLPTSFGANPDLVGPR